MAVLRPSLFRMDNLCGDAHNANTTPSHTDSAICVLE